MKLQTKTYANNPTSVRQAIPSAHHYVRTLVASFFGFLAVTFIFASLVVLWLNHTLTNTNAFVSTVAPLAAKADIQTFVAQKATSSLLDSAPTEDLSVALLGPEQALGKTTDQLKNMLQPIVQAQVQDIVRSPQFATLWASGLRSAHSQLLQQLNSGAPELTLNLRPVLVGVINQLAVSKLKVVSDKLQLSADSGTLRIQGDKVAGVRHAYKALQDGTWALVAAAVVMAVLCVVTSVHHLKTVRRVLIASGISALVLALGLHLVSLVQAKGADAVQQRAVATAASTLAHGLFVVSLVFGVVCIVVAIGTKLYQKIRVRR